MTKPVKNLDVGNLIQDLSDKVDSLERAISSPSVLVKPDYQSGWLDYSDQSFGPVTYYRDILGVVHISGLVSKSTAWSPSETIMILEEGYRPVKNIVKATIADNRFERLTINRIGGISPVGLVAWASAGSWISLNISFSTLG